MDDFDLKTFHTLKEEDVKDLEVVSDEDFSDIVNLMFLNDYKRIPEFVRLPDLNKELSDKLGLAEGASFILKKRIAHIRPSRKGLYNQVLSFDEYCDIPRVIREATFVVVDKVHHNFQVVFDDMDGDLSKINKLVFNKDNFGNYLVTLGKVDRRDAFSESLNTVVGVGFAPTIQALRSPSELPVTRFRASPTTDNSIISNIEEKSSVSLNDKDFSRKKAAYYSGAAEKEDVDFVKARYEEKASYWDKISRNEAVSPEEEARCAPGHKRDAVDNYVYARHCLGKVQSPEEAAECYRKMEFWEKAVREEMKVDALVKALAERDEKLAPNIGKDDQGY